MSNKIEPFKIALLTNGIYPITIGGMQKHSYYLAKNLAQIGAYVDVFYIPHKDKAEELLLIDKNFSSIEQERIKFIPVEWPRERKYPGHYVVENYNYSKQIFKQLNTQKKNYSFIYAKGFSGWYILRMKKKGIQFPTVGVKFHGYEMFQISPSIKYFFEKLLLQWPVKWNNINADYVFSYGGKITNIVKEIGVRDEQIIEIPTGIDESWLNDTSTEGINKRLQFVFIGRYERRKGIQELNDVIELIQNHNYFTFHFIGPIPYKKQIKSENIIYHGTVMDQERIKLILQQSDVLVCPSFSEGMPNVIMEAMASGCAIIATDVGAVRDQVDDENGFLIKPGNKEELKAAIEKMISLPKNEITKMKNVSIQRIKEKFLWKNVAERTLNEIRKVTRMETEEEKMNNRL